MPLTAKGEEIKRAMESEYGSAKGERVFYASKNKGTISGVDAASRMDAAAQRMHDCAMRADAICARMDDWSPEARKAAAEARKRGGGPSHEERIASQRETFGFATGSPETKSTVTFKRRNSTPEKKPGGTTGRLLRGWRGE